jgi:hypothetical protein
MKKYLSIRMILLSAIGPLLFGSFGCKKDNANKDSITNTPAVKLPTLTTSAIYGLSTGLDVTQKNAVSGGNITSDGGDTIIARGICWSRNQSPTIADSKSTDGTGTGIFSSSLSGLTQGVFYYVRAYATNNVGTAYGNEVAFITLLIGDKYQGGTLVYILGTGDPGYIAGEIHGLITDRGRGQKVPLVGWFNGSYTAIGAAGSAIGSGITNTNTIVTTQGAGDYAAKYCYDLVVDSYDDWFLPSKDELNKAYVNKDLIGGWSDAINTYYWTSTEGGANTAWIQTFFNGNQSTYDKNGTFYVRPFRAF